MAIKLLRGTESDILRDGSLDYPDRIHKQFDIIIASIHNRYKLDEDEMTRRVITAMKNPFFKIWVIHWTAPRAATADFVPSRRNSGCHCRNSAAIEISGVPDRLDMEPRWTRDARMRQIKFVISTDAHSISDMQNLKFGVGIARRAGVRRGEVLNTLDAGAFQKWVRPSTRK